MSEGDSYRVALSKIGLPGFRTRDHVRIRRALYRRSGKEWMTLSGNLATKFKFTTNARVMTTSTSTL
jgi:hypothetical protein